MIEDKQQILLTRTEHYVLCFLVEYTQRLAIGRFIDTNMLSYEDKIEMIIRAGDESYSLMQALKLTGNSYVFSFTAKDLVNLAEMIGTLTETEVSMFISPETVKELGTKEARRRLIDKLTISPEPTSKTLN